jgi:trehalose 6-phosphate phosphatase
MDSIPSLRGSGCYAFFLDFDGTLSEIADTPATARIEDRARQALEALFRTYSGAVAIVTGREIASIDALLSPLHLPVAGVHGLERRNGAGTLSSHKTGEEAAQLLESILKPFVTHNPGLMLEKKRGALALHYRLRPDLEALCLSLVEDAAAASSDVVLTRGKMVVETRFHKATKGTAVRDFLQEVPFQGRIPFFAGDDATDEDAFATVNGLGGISVKVGPGETLAHYRCASVSAFTGWLSATAGLAEGNRTHG